MLFECLTVANGKYCYFILSFYFATKIVNNMTIIKQKTCNPTLNSTNYLI